MLTPVSRAKWTYETAAHLLNRAGFGGNPGEIDALVALGPVGAVEKLLQFGEHPGAAENPEWAKPDPARFRKFQEMRQATEKEKREMRREEQKQQRENIQDLRYWWLKRMASDADPLREKLTLFWHGHFATSAQKVRSAYFMWRQNDLFRRYGSGDWLKLLTEVSKDPAMLIWLDQAQSRKEHPNENFAREVMELFALGEGNYSEKDITEGARALTGWSLDRLNGEFVYRPRMHDPGEKAIFGKKGKFDGDDFLKLIVQHPQSDRFITRKLWTFFVSEDPSDLLVENLAATFRGQQRNFRPFLRTLFLSEEFYAAKVMGQQVKSPVQWLISSVRLLERDLPPAAMITGALRQLGQDLLMPPNVKGWDGGLSWINTSALINRYNYAAFLVTGENMMGSGRDRPQRRRMAGRAPVDVDKLFPPDVAADKDKLIAALQKRFIQGPLRPETESVLRAALDNEKLKETDVLRAIQLVMSTPEFQLA